MVLVIEPLVSINEEIIKRLKNIGFSATYIGRDDKESTGITEGLFEFVFSSAENILAKEIFVLCFLHRIINKKMFYL